MSEESKEKRRIRVHEHKRLGSVEVSEVVSVPPVDGILSKAVSTIANEINKLHIRSHRQDLTDKQARILHGYIKALVDLSKEQRERDKAEDLSKMSDEELFGLAKQILQKREQHEQSEVLDKADA